MTCFRALSFPILFLLLGTACHTVSGPGSLKPLPFGVMDEPRNGETLHGAAQVRGWALSESGIAQVRIYVDRNYVASATLGADRPDVIKAFPAFASHADAGWAAVIDTGRFNAGAHEIVAQAIANNGATRDIGDINITIAKP